MKHLARLLAVAVLIASAVLATVPAGTQNSQLNSRPLEEPPYHSQPATGPLPPTLDPQQFRQDRAAYVSYAVAARIKGFLFQIPCYCMCRKIEGHESLLDCFVGKHGVKCSACQKEVIFCYMQSRRGKTPAETREAIASGKVGKLDLNKEIRKLFGQVADGR
jgi:hypothetical protein